MGRAKDTPSISPEMRKREGQTTYSRFIVAPPLSPQGYSLQLIGNIPQNLTAREERIARKKIAPYEKSLKEEGSWDGLHVNITSVRVVNGISSDGTQVIQYTTAPATYFQQRIAVDGTQSYETERKLSHSGATLFAITGDNKIVVSSRPDNVQLYKRMLCATASGSWDGEYQESSQGAALPILVPPTPDSAVRHIQKELHEETGLPYEDITAPESKLRILGVAEDTRKKHWEILYMLQLPRKVTSAEMRLFHKEEKTNGNGHDNDPTAGHLIFIDATPQSIEKFLTQMQTPWDPQSEQGLIAVGYMLKMEEQLAEGASLEESVHTAKQWMRQTEEATDTRYAQLNTIARKARRRGIIHAQVDWIFALKDQASLSPEKRQRARQERKAAGKLIREYRARSRRLDPHLSPEAQGISGIKEELQRNGILNN